MVKRYRKKPVVIEAIQYHREKNINQVQAWFDRYPDSRALGYDADLNEYFIKTLEGDMFLSSGDFIIRGIAGEFYPCKPDIFHQTYEAIEEGEDE